MRFLRGHLDKLGLGGSLLAALCCLGVPAVLSFLGAVGAGFLINDAVLQPLLVVFLLVFLAGLLPGWRRHRSPWPLAVGLASALVLYLFIFVKFVPVLPYAGLAGMLAASVLNVRARRACAPGAPEGACRN